MTISAKCSCDIQGCKNKGQPYKFGSSLAVFEVTVCKEHQRLFE